MSGEGFNINSPKQMKEVLFEKMKLEPVQNKKNKSGLSTAAGELEKMLGQHPVIEKIMQYRELSKLQSTYLLALPELVNKKPAASTPITTKLSRLRADYRLWTPIYRTSR